MFHESKFSRSKKKGLFPCVAFRCWLRGRLKGNWWNMDFSFHFPTRINSFHPPPSSCRKKRGNESWNQGLVTGALASAATASVSCYTTGTRQDFWRKALSLPICRAPLQAPDTATALDRNRENSAPVLRKLTRKRIFSSRKLARKRVIVAWPWLERPERCLDDSFHFNLNTCSNYKLLTLVW